MKKDIELIREHLLASYPKVKLRQLQVTHSADDDGLWFFALDNGTDLEIQLESTSGMCPFLVETSETSVRHTANTTQQAVDLILKLLHLD